nr:3685_t:CDS:2 [Entrophospora candida]
MLTSIHKNKDKALNNITNIGQEHDTFSNQFTYIDNHLGEMNKAQIVKHGWVGSGQDVGERVLTQFLVFIG